MYQWRNSVHTHTYTHTHTHTHTHIYIYIYIYMYMYIYIKVLALNNSQGLVYHETPTKLLNKKKPWQLPEGHFVQQRLKS